MLNAARLYFATRKSLKLQRASVESCISTLNDFRERLAAQVSRLGPPEWLSKCELQIVTVGNTLETQRKRTRIATSPIAGLEEQLLKSLDVIDYWDAKLADRIFEDVGREAFQNSLRSFGKKTND